MPAGSPAEIVRRLFAARARGDVGAVLALMDPDVVATTLADGTVLRGAAEVGAYIDGERGGDRRTEVEAHHVEAAGEVVTVRGRIRVFAGGCLADSPACWRFVVQAGRVLRIDPLPFATQRVAA